ncbi:hypothetical protein BMF77_01929 [Dolichospermum sp. UHCC 0315A]|nr:DUF433 domain-containing protein [Dolichospermum sp. UHCC 0315A]QEI41344.1 hypothetical protein BMF77_01929 [Dolichospermum sp. UHCC 0315A]
MATIKQFKNIKNKLKLSDFSDIIRANNSLDNSMSVNVIKEHIEITPGICGGKPRIAGHRIRVQDIVIWHEQMGMSPDEILYHYPSITLSDVYAALAYYHDHREEIRQQISESEALIQEIQAQTPSILQQKLKKRNDREN